MTEEIIKSITAAEEQAAQYKRNAVDEAACILTDAQAQATRLENSAAEVCRAYRETQMKNAVNDAEKEYASALRAKENEAKAYCEAALAGSEASVGKIVGRILGGDC